MTTKYELPKNSKEFKRLAEMLAALTEYEIIQIENEKDKTMIIHKMPIVISLVNTLGFLRGQEGAFSRLSIKDADAQDYIKSNENIFEKRLHDLISNVIAGNNLQTRYRNKLERFFVEFRACKDTNEYELYQMVKDFVIETQRVSATAIQTKFRLGFSISSRMVTKLEEDGIVSSPDENKKRVVLVSNLDDLK